MSLRLFVFFSLSLSSHLIPNSSLARHTSCLTIRFEVILSFCWYGPYNSWPLASCKYEWQGDIKGLFVQSRVACNFSDINPSRDYSTKASLHTRPTNFCVCLYTNIFRAVYRPKNNINHGLFDHVLLSERCYSSHQCNPPLVINCTVRFSEVRHRVFWGILHETQKCGTRHKHCKGSFS